MSPATRRAIIKLAHLDCDHCGLTDEELNAWIDLVNQARCAESAAAHIARLPKDPK